MIPTLERHGGTLWYAVPYEGFEASDHVVYTHACPNQHLLPLLDWVIPAQGAKAYLTGSNYIWGWEMNRLARERIVQAGGMIAGERYLPIGSRDVGRMIEEIRSSRPDFVLNSLIGPSSYEFLAAYRDLGRQDDHFLPARCPVLSCNLTECELPAIGMAAEGLVSAGPYFRGIEGWPARGASDRRTRRRPTWRCANWRGFWRTGRGPRCWPCRSFWRNPDRGAASSTPRRTIRCCPPSSPGSRLAPSG